MASISPAKSAVSIGSLRSGTIVRNPHYGGEYLIVGTTGGMISMMSADYGHIVVYDIENKILTHSRPDWDVEIVGTLEL